MTEEEALRILIAFGDQVKALVNINSCDCQDRRLGKSVRIVANRIEIAQAVNILRRSFE